MHFKHYDWTVEKLISLRSTIDLTPLYQRGEAWDDNKRALLLDSILNGFDIPKIYLRHTKDIGNHDYELADGQQRLTAIWKFTDNDLELQGMTASVAHLNGKRYRDLTEEERKRILNYSLITTVVYQATGDQVRELFRRLQLGVRLNPAELRNSMASAIGNEIRAVAVNHKFFRSAPFSVARYKADDLTAHLFAILIYQRQRDIKAPDLKYMYQDFATSVDLAVVKKADEILRFMDDMQLHSPRCICTKWGFVDLVGVLADRRLKMLDPIH